MNNRLSNSSTKEQDIPDSLRGSSKWLKDLYGDLSSVKPVGISQKKRLESLLSDFNTEAENIGKLDLKTRDLPHIQEYMKNKYGKSHIFGSSEGIIGSQGKSNAPDNSVPDNSKKSISLPKYSPFPKQLSPDTGRSIPNTPTLNFPRQNDSIHNYPLATGEDSAEPENLPFIFGKHSNKVVPLDGFTPLNDEIVQYTSLSKNRGRAYQNARNSTSGNTPKNSVSSNFDYDTTLSYSQEYDARVETLQKRLVDLGYLDVPEGEWGYFGRKTQAAVNAYKEDHDLGNDGEYYGVVGKETWQSLGLLYREQKDIDAGVEIVVVDGKQYFDISKAVETAVSRAKDEFEKKGDSSFLEKTLWFIGQVNDDEAWDIKSSRKTWGEALGVSPSTCEQWMIFKGRVVSPEDMGNITYGYLGTALGLDEKALYVGSTGNHIANHLFHNLENEKKDLRMVKLGIDWYNGKDIGVSISAKRN